MSSAGTAWWRSAVTYQIYPRSFADGNGDGVGDIAGIRSKLGYLADLGVDAIWITPWYPSPMADAGYDVSDYRDIEPVFGTLAEADRLIEEAHALGLRILLDIVPNHTSVAHPWFAAALAGAPGSAERERYVFRDGRGPQGDEPPNDWTSEFGGPAWTRVTDPSGRPGQWYLHLFAPAQPDLNWTDIDVRADFERTLRFWFDRGVDGLRVDAAHGLVKDSGLADAGSLAWPLPPGAGDDVQHPHWDQPGLHDIYRSWREIADTYVPQRVFAGEVCVGRADRLVRYVRPDELHSVFNFEFLQSPWRPDVLRSTIDETIESHRSVGAAPVWVLENHDVPRVVSRYSREQPRQRTIIALEDLLRLPADSERGRLRARAGLLLMLALPGGAYLFQGQELGLPEVEDLPEDALQDPLVRQSGGLRRGRDGCRVPLPWSGDQSPFGFSPPRSSAPPWLPQPQSWSALTVQAQAGDASSMLELCRTAVRLRRESSWVRSEDLRWLPGPKGSLVFARGDGLRCVVNVDAEPFALPPDVGSGDVLLASGPLSAAGLVPRDTAVWLPG
jgi:alpha-glucosidase